MYDPFLALEAIDENKVTIFICLLGAVVFSFVYFIIAVRMAIKQQLYVVPFLGASLFFFHDLSFVLYYETWATVYGNHWWLLLWTFALMGTVALELFLIWQVIKYGHKELAPDMSKGAFTAGVIIATLGVGATAWLVKATLNDPIYLVTFAITAVWSVPFHTGIMLRRRSRAGQSIAMEISVMIIFACVSTVLMIASPFFRQPAYLVYFAVFELWPLLNIWLIMQYPKISSKQTGFQGSVAVA